MPNGVFEPQEPFLNLRLVKLLRLIFGRGLLKTDWVVI